mgnify:CR=1 FL=1
MGIKEDVKQQMFTDKVTTSKLVLFNDDYHTFEYVINMLVEVCKHTHVQAEQCTWLVHFKGKCTVKTGALKDLKPPKDKDKGVAQIKEYISKWNSLGKVPNDKRFIEGKFQKVIDTLLTNLEMDKNEVEMIKFENKLESIDTSENTKNLDNERLFIRKKIDDVKSGYF